MSLKKILSVFVLAIVYVTFLAGTGFAIGYDALTDKVKAYSQGKMSHEEALAFFSGISADQSNEPKVRALALATRARVYLSMGDRQKGVADVKASWAIDDSIPAGYVTMALVMLVEDNFASASDFFQTASEKSATDEGKKNNEKWAALTFALANARTAADLHTEMTANLFAAEEKYKGKLIGIRGPVSKIGRTFSGLPEITMKVASFKDVECELTQEDIPNMAKLKKGDEILLVCRLKKVYEVSVQLTECTMWKK